MGKIWPDHGKISIETRTESFVIHAGYGYEPKRERIIDMEVGEWFYFADPERIQECCLLSRRDNTVQRGEQAYYRVGKDGVDHLVPSNKEMVIPCYSEGEPNQEKDVESSFGERWRDDHPEFRNEDLPHLIAALQEVLDVLDGISTPNAKENI